MSLASPPRRRRRLVVWAAATILALLAALAAHSWFARPLHIRIFYERAFGQQVLQSPQRLSSLRLLPAWMDWYSDDLDDHSLARLERSQAWAREQLATLREYDRADLADPVSYDIMEHYLLDRVEGQPYALHNHPVNPLFGVQNDLPSFLAAQHPVASEREAADYIARLQQFPRVFDQVLEGLRKRESLGIVPPTFAVEKSLQQMRALVEQPPDAHILVTSLAAKLERAQGMQAQRRAHWLQRAREVVGSHVTPAYRRLIAHNEALLPRTRGNHGAWSLPDGEAFYSWAVRHHTTTTRTPDELHETGLAEVARIGAEMDVLLRQVGLADGSVGERVSRLSQRHDQLYPDTPEGRLQILQDYRIIIKLISEKLGTYFETLPRHRVEVRRVPEFRERSAPSAYYEAPAFDGSRPGVFFANLHDIRATPRLGMRTLAYHEALPGHHLQKALQRELTGLPMFRKALGFAAFSEGWALYAERLATEMGGNPAATDELGRLRAEMFRAARLVVDTGLHHKRWTREQAIAYMREQTGMAPSAVEAEVERYLVAPGQALAYKVGMMEILRLREEAKRRMGARFDIRRFHAVVLGGGDLPLAVLERRVKAYMESEPQ